MELIYSMRRKPLKCEPPQIESDPEAAKPICTISSANIIAFSSATELLDSEGDSWGGHVYVCDLDTPWNSHRVTSTQNPVTALEWDTEGKNLLVGTSVGNVSVYCQREHLLNDWTCLYTASFPGEYVMKAVLFHNGRRVALADTKKPDAPASERFQQLRPAPTLRGFGGVAHDGACIVTATGLLGALLPPAPSAASEAPGPSRAGPPSPPRAHVATESLRGTRHHIAAASFAHKNGNLLIASICRDGAGARCVCCHLASVRRAAPPQLAPLLAVQLLPSLYATDDSALCSPLCISWCVREDGDSLLVGGSSLSLWKLTERSYQVHKLLAKGPVQGSAPPAAVQKQQDCFNTLVWQQTALWSWEAGAGAAVGVVACNPPPSRAVLATPRALHLLYRDKLTHVGSKPVVTGGTPGTADLVPASGTPPKKAKYGTAVLPSGVERATVCSLDVSWLGAVAVALDTHSQLHVYKLPLPQADIPSPLSVQHATSLLEYGMVSGHDTLDVLLTLKANVREPVLDRLTESFQRQPAAFKQFYYMSWLTLRTALCRLLPNGQCRASELTSLQTLHAAWACVEASVRPSEAAAADKGPLDALHALIEDQPATHADLDKMLLSLDAKELSCEPGTLQALRRVLERALDIALSLLISLPHASQLPAPQHHHSYELWSDPCALKLLRKIMAVARVWSVSAAGAGAAGARVAVAHGHPLAAARAPDSLDVLPLVYRPITRLLAGKPADVLEECAVLASQAGGARFWESLPRCCVSAPHGRPWPLYLEYGAEPEALRYTPERPSSADAGAPPPPIDSIRYMYLGGGSHAARWRECGRCGALALAAAQCARHPAQRAHDARFLAACRCGGKWTLCSNVRSVSQSNVFMK